MSEIQAGYQTKRFFTHLAGLTQTERDGLLIYKTFAAGREETLELIREDLPRGQVFLKADRDACMHVAYGLLLQETFTRCSKGEKIIASDLPLKWQSAFAALRYCTATWEEACRYQPLFKLLRAEVDTEKKFDTLREIFSAIALADEPKLSLERHLAFAVLNQLDFDGGPKVCNAASLDLSMFGGGEKTEPLRLISDHEKRLCAHFAESTEGVLNYISIELCRDELSFGPLDRKIVLNRALMRLAKKSICASALSFKRSRALIGQWENAISAISALRRFPAILPEAAGAFKLAICEVLRRNGGAANRLKALWSTMPDEKCRLFALGILKQLREERRQAA